jgi:hypothetical protein
MHRYEIGLLPSPSVDAATVLQGEAGAFLVFFSIAPIPQHSTARFGVAAKLAGRP